MIDSGSTFTYLMSREYPVFIGAFKTQLKKNMIAANKPVQEVSRPRVSYFLDSSYFCLFIIVELLILLFSEE